MKVRKCLSAQSKAVLMEPCEATAAKPAVGDGACVESDCFPRLVGWASGVCSLAISVPSMTSLMMTTMAMILECPGSQAIASKLWRTSRLMSCQVSHAPLVRSRQAGPFSR